MRVISSILDILNLGFLKYLISEVSAEKTRGMQVNFPAKQLGEFVLHIEECETRLPAFLKIHQNINVTLRSEIIPQSGAENSQPLDMMPPAKICNLISRYDQVFVHCTIRNYSSGSMTLCSLKTLPLR